MLLECKISNSIFNYFTNLIPNLTKHNDNWLLITKRCFGNGTFKKDGPKVSVLILIFLEIFSIFKLKANEPDKFISPEISITRIKMKLNNLSHIARKLKLDKFFCNSLNL